MFFYIQFLEFFEMLQSTYLCTIHTTLKLILVHNTFILLIGTIKSVFLDNITYKTSL